MKTLNIDIETYSDEDIRKSGLFRYAQSRAFQIMLFAYSLDNGPVEVIDLMSGEILPENIRSMLVNPMIKKKAYNAVFEWFCLNQAGITTPLNQWECTMVHGLYAGITSGLGAVGEALGLPQDKLKDRNGRKLIDTFCKPRKPTKRDPRTRTLPEHEPEKWELFREYCRQDVVTEMAVGDKLSAFPVPESEWNLWRVDVAINEFGVNMDKNLIDMAVNIGETVKEEQIIEAQKISGVDNPASGGR